jgi:hypothetical protein
MYGLGDEALCWSAYLTLHVQGPRFNPKHWDYMCVNYLSMSLLAYEHSKTIGLFTLFDLKNEF